MRKAFVAFIFGLSGIAPALWAQSPQLIWQESVDSDRVNCLAFTSDGSELITGSSDRLIHLFDPASGNVLQTLDSQADAIHANSVECLAVNSASTMIASVCSNELRLWDIPSGTQHAIDADPSWNVWVDISPGGGGIALASFDGTIRVFDTSGNQQKVFPSDGYVQRVCVFSPNGQWLASAGGDAKITVRNTSDWSVAAVLTGHTSDIYDMRFSPDSSMIASGSYDETCRLWSTADWSLLKTYSAAEINGAYGVYAVAFSPDSKTLAYSEGENNRIRLVDTTSLNITATYDQNTPNVQCMAFSPATGYLAYGCADTTLYLANVGVSGNGGGGTTGGGGGSSQLTVTVNGNGRVSPNRNTETLTVGRKYSLTAVPNAGNLFVDWTDGSGNVLGTTPTLAFTMQDGLVLNANFVTSPFPALAGLYEGLITSDSPSAAGSGRINIRVGAGGGFTGSFWLNGAAHAIAGKFLTDGSYSGRVGAITLTLQLDVSGGSDQIAGNVSNGSISANVSADLDTWNARSNPAPAGVYTALIAPDTSQTDSPQGYGVARIVVTAAGVVTVTGTLADGTPFAESTYLSKNNTWPLYVSVGAREALVGQVTVENLSGSDMDASLSWFHAAVPHAAYFANGFSASPQLVASAFAAPARGQTTLNFGDTSSDNASVTINGADVSGITFNGVVQNSGRFTADSASSPPRAFTMTLGVGGGASGSFIDPTTGRRVTIVGEVLQKQNTVAGFFLSGGQSGSVQLSPVAQ